MLAAMGHDTPTQLNILLARTARLCPLQCAGDRETTTRARVAVRMNPYEVGYAGMDSKGPFSSVSGTLMGIPFCIAATLLRGTQTMAMLTTYDAPVVNALMDRMEVVADPEVPTLCSVIAVTLADGSEVVQDQRMTTDDYAYDRARVVELVRRIGAEEGVPAAAYDRRERFVAGLPAGSVTDVVGCFALLPPARAAAAE
jgi:2-methylcitrate dehydratase PrpD